MFLFQGPKGDSGLTGETGRVGDPVSCYSLRDPRVRTRKGYNMFSFNC